MKTYALKNLIIISLSVLFISSCQENSDLNSSENDKDIDIRLAKIMESESISDNDEVVLIDTFKTSEIRIIHFIDKNDKNKIYEKQYHNTGEIYIEGGLYDNKRTGKWVSWYKNKVIWSIGHYENGERHGLSEAYYENGTLRFSQNYEHGALNGMSKHYDANGKLLGEIMYKDNQIIWQKGEVK